MLALRHHEISPALNPTGEDLLDRTVRPFKIWVPAEKCIVVGNSQAPEKEVVSERVAADRLPVFKRMGGGGAVLLSPGCLCVALRFAKKKSATIQDYFGLGSDLIRRAVALATGLDLEARGISDLAIWGRKVVGCSLYMPREFVLYLASVLVNPDMAEIDRYLAHPSQEPDYRAGRTHRDFLVGLKEMTGEDLAPETLAHYVEAEISRTLTNELDWELASPTRLPIST